MSNINCFALGRINTIPLDITGNYNKILKITNQAKAKGITFVAFPELSLTGYNCGDLFNHQELTKAALNSLFNLKYELPEGISVGVGLPLLGTDNRVYDAYVILQKGKILGVSTPVSFYNAKDQRLRYFCTPFDNELTFIIGAESFYAASEIYVDDNKIAVVFNDGNLDTLENPDVIVCPEATRYELNTINDREAKLLEISRAYDCVLLSTNLSGCESGSDIFDSHAIIGNKGNLVARGSFLSFADASLVTAESGIYEYLGEYDTIVRAVSLGLFDWMKKTRSHGFALSMSGGADSGLCATCICYAQIAALKELGYDNYKTLMESLKFTVPAYTGDEQSFIKQHMMPQVLTTVYQGSAISGSVTRTAASKVSANLGAKHFEWSIAGLVEKYVSLINETTPGDPLNWDRDDLTLQNIQARSRGPGIWMMANRYNKLLVTTCNASEDAVGYCTMDGDTCGGVAPIGDISKSRILKINQHIADNGLEIEKNGLKLDCPDMSYISAQAPTAELRAGGQTDERDLMPYVILDRIHVLHQSEMMQPKYILEELTKEYKEFTREELKTFVIKYFKKFAQNQWKREKSATTFHIEATDLNAKSGFIFPLLNDGYTSLLENI